VVNLVVVVEIVAEAVVVVEAIKISFQFKK
jgi:hypothetical protein